MSNSNRDLLIILANGLAVSLEMSYDAVELREMWSDEVEALKQARHVLTQDGIAVPAAVENVIRLADEG